MYIGQSQRSRLVGGHFLQRKNKRERYDFYRNIIIVNCHKCSKYGNY